LNFAIVLGQVFASSQVNGNVGRSSLHIETVTEADSVDSSDGAEDDNEKTDTDSDSVFLHNNITELPALD